MPVGTDHLEADRELNDISHSRIEIERPISASSTMRSLISFVLVCVATARPWGCIHLPSSSVRHVAQSLRGGDDYASQLESVKSNVLKKANEAIEELRQEIVDKGSIVSDFGSKAEMICNQAMQDFASAAPEGDDLFDRKLQDLEAAVDAPLQVLYLKQLALARESALQKFRAATKTSGISDYEAMLQADNAFVQLAEESTRQGSDWDYSTERSFLQAVMNNIAESSRKAIDVQMSSAQQQQTAMQFLHSQQEMIRQLQMQLYGQSSPWNVGVAYRIPDTNFNIQGSYQQGRANVQLSCVPDEYAPFLGPNGFTNGVGPGNLGLSINLSV